MGIYIKKQISLCTNITQPLIHRKNDRFIMDTVISSSIFNKKEIRYINHCRIFLQVLTLSDIVNSKGDVITESSYEVKKDINRHSNYKWPYIPTPTPIMIKSWQKALGIFTKNGKTLLIPLQEIINKSHQTLTSTINIQKNIVYIKHDQTWKIFKKKYSIHTTHPNLPILFQHTITTKLHSTHHSECNRRTRPHNYPFHTGTQ